MSDPGEWLRTIELHRSAHRYDAALLAARACLDAIEARGPVDRAHARALASELYFVIGARPSQGGAAAELLSRLANITG
jgi:hypothetical protein